jgi:tetratricopeptide (TPR) repeat protein
MIRGGSMFPNPSARVLGGAILAAALTFILPDSGPAQQAMTVATRTPVSSEATATSTRASYYRQRAEKLYGSPARWGELVELSVQAAREATLDDPYRVDDLYLAGVLAARLGRLDESARYLEEAATAALEMGDPAKAAQSYLLAAAVAKEIGRHENADHLILHARMLRQSGLLGDAECHCVDQRIAMLTGATVPPADF